MGQSIRVEFKYKHLERLIILGFEDCGVPG
jgi:hypothetical protein